jgi:preprotein translocase subunit SecG
LETALLIAEIIIAVALIVVILLQVKAASLGSAFGGSDSSLYTTRRGVDRILFNLTIVFAVIFLILAAMSARVFTPAA